MSTPVDPDRVAGGDGNASAWAGAPEGSGHRREIPRTALHFGWGRRLPVILQSEAAECGLACLAMVASYHGF
ncbi:MAG: cysteine peptidase family C39 domain-containing protein, partial [Metallibacterium sp.]